jgi:hypothetical protein
METSHTLPGSYKFTDGWHSLHQMEIKSARHMESREEASLAVRYLRMPHLNPNSTQALNHHAHTHHPRP